MKNKKITWWKRYLSTEISVDYKTGIYFFCVLFYYALYRIYCHSWQLPIIYLTEMLITTYLICYVQVCLLGNFDEAEHIGMRELLNISICCCLHTAASILFGWFDNKHLVSAALIFFVYMLIVYGCISLANRIKRTIDTRNLNQELNAFKQRRNLHENN